MTRADEARLMAGVVATLREEFPHEAPEAIGSRVERAYTDLDQARIRDFVPILVARMVRQDLRSRRAWPAGRRTGPPGAVVPPADVTAARQLAWQVLHGLVDRWRHTVAVAARAAEVAGAVPSLADRHLLVAAAWLHDIGYAPSLQDSGFHPLDGARYLERTGWPPRLAALVAHHSGARFVAQARGLGAALSRFRYEESAVSDALTFADQTTGPAGQRLPIEERIAESLDRHGPDSPQVAVHRIRGPYLLAAAGRVQRRRAGYAVPLPRSS